MKKVLEMRNKLAANSASNPRWSVATLLLLFTLVSCGGGGDPVSPANNGSATPPVSTAPADTDRVVTGAASKGPISNAGVSFFEIDAFGFPLSTPIASTTTDASGNFTVTIPDGVTGSILVETSGGTFVDESDQEPDPTAKRQITLGPGEGFLSLLPEGATTVAITPYTHTLVRQSQEDTILGNFDEIFSAASDRLSAEIGFDAVTTIPTDPVAPAASATASQVQYAMLLGAFASIVNNASIQLGEATPTYEIIQAVMEDLADGRLDGQYFGDPVIVFRGDTAGNTDATGETDLTNPGATGTATLPTNINFNAELNRFRNNNFANYEGVVVPSPDGDALFNAPPLAQAGPDQTVPQAAAVSLDGSGSSDPDGTIDRFEWIQESGPIVSLTGADTASPTFTAPSAVLAAPAPLVFKLVVIDNEGRGDVDFVQIDVVPALAPTSFVIDELLPPEENGIDTGGGAVISFSQDGTGTIIGDHVFQPGITVFDWTEDAGLITLDFARNGGFVQDRFVDFFDNGLNGEDEIEITETIDFFEFTILVEGTSRDEVDLRAIGQRTFVNLTQGGTLPSESIDETEPVAFYDASVHIRFPDAPGRRMLPTDAQSGTPTLFDDELFDDDLTFNTDFTGFALTKNLSFTWSIEDDGHLRVLFSDDTVGDYFHFSTRDSGQVIGVIYTFPDGTQGSDGFLSFVQDGSAWDAATAAGIYLAEGNERLDDGTVVRNDSFARLNPDGTAVLERFFIDPLSGQRFPDFQSGFLGYCWDVDANGDLVINGIFPQDGLPLSPSECDLLPPDDETSFRFKVLLFEQSGTTYKTLRQEFQNDDPFSGSGILAQRDSAASIFEKSALPSNPAFPIGDNGFVNADASPTTIDILANDVAGDAPIDPATVRLEIPPSSGTVTFNATTGVATYTPDGLSSPGDSFYYRVSDTNGVESTFAPVFLEGAPLADAGGDRRVSSLSSVTLDGTGSTPANGVLTYSWVQIAGDPVTLDDPTIATPTFTAGLSYVTPGVLTFELTTVDSGGNTGTDVANITIDPALQPVNYTVQRLALPSQFGNDILAGNRIELDPGNTGTYADGANISPLTWFESGGKLFLDFSANVGGGHVLSINSFDEAGVPVVETNYLDSIEITLVQEGFGIDEVSSRQLTRVVRTEDGISVPDVVNDNTVSRTVYAPEAALPASVAVGDTRSLMADLSLVITDTSSNGFKLDELTFVDAANGTTRYMGTPFTWLVDVNNNLSVEFATVPTQVVTYYHFETGPSGDIVFAEFDLSGEMRVVADLSYSRNSLNNPPTWSAATVPGIYTTRGSTTLSDGNLVPQDLFYRLHANGVGVLELLAPDESGIPQLTRSSRAICWEIDGNGDLVYNRLIVLDGSGTPLFTGNVPDSTFCTTNAPVEGNLSLRRTNSLFAIDGAMNYQTLVKNEVNNGTGFPFPGGILEFSNTFTRLSEFIPFNGSQVPPIISNSAISIPIPDTPTLLSTQTDLAFNVVDDGPLDFNSVQIVVEPNLGLATVATGPAGNEGDIDYITTLGAPQVTLDLFAEDGVTPITAVNGAEVGKLVATVLDGTSFPLAGVTVNFSATLGQLAATSAITDFNGEARVDITAGNIAGTGGTVSADPTFQDRLIYRISDLDGNLSTYGTIFIDNQVSPITATVPIDVGGLGAP